MRVTPAREIKRACPGQRLMTSVLRQSGGHLSEVGSGGEVRSPEGGPRRPTHGCLPRPCLLPPHSLTPPTATRRTVLRSFPRLEVTDPSPAFSQGAPRHSSVSGLGPPARKEETQESSPLLPPTELFHAGTARRGWVSSPPALPA